MVSFQTRCAGANTAEKVSLSSHFHTALCGLRHLWWFSLRYTNYKNITFIHHNPRIRSSPYRIIFSSLYLVTCQPLFYCLSFLTVSILRCILQVFCGLVKFWILVWTLLDLNRVRLLLCCVCPGSGCMLWVVWFLKCLTWCVVLKVFQHVAW